MFNMGSIMKIMSAKNQFTQNHPKFVQFLTMVLGSGVPEDTVIEITVTKPGEEPITSNIKILQSDLDLFEELKGLGKMM